LDQHCNELATLAQREKLFAKVTENLMPYGLFVCDWMSGTYFEELMHSNASQEITEEKVSFSSWKHKKNSYKQQLLTFTHMQDNLYSRQETAITYFSPTLEQIKGLAKKYF
jgi:serine/threonine protein phosphatase PrpC